MANTITLGLDGATIILKIGTKTYILTAPYQELTFGADPAATQRVHFRFKETYENAVDFGTINQLLTEVEALVFSTPLAAADGLTAKWTAVQTTLQNAPILGSAVQTVVNTNVRILEIEFDVKKTTTYNGGVAQTSEFEGSLRLGVMFTPQAANRPRFFNVEVIAFGGVLAVKFSGTANGAFPW